MEVKSEEIDLDVIIPTSSPLHEKHAQESVEAFYVHVFKRTLDTIE